MAEKRPETSTVATALGMGGAALDLATYPAELTTEERVQRIETLLRGAKDLRGHQVDDLVEWLRDRAHVVGPAREAEDLPRLDNTA